MNIFYLDKDIDRCAEAHIDKHVTKMILEHAQLLCTALWIDDSIGCYPEKLPQDKLKELKDFEKSSPLPKTIRYKPFAPNHPSNIWVRESTENFEYLWLLTEALNTEAMWRGFNSHKSWEVVKNLPLPKNMPKIGFTQPAQAMPDNYRNPDSITAYRTYYLNDKAEIAHYTRRLPPSWWWRNPKSEENYVNAVRNLEHSIRLGHDDTLVWKKQTQEILLMGRDT